MTDKAAAFAATYSDFRLVKGRKVCQFVFEVPLERADEAMTVLGGMPNPAAETWCAVARLQQQPTMEEAAQPRPSPDDSPPGTGGAKSWHDMKPSQQAGVLCGDVAFQRFLAERYDLVVQNSEDAASAVRNLCGVQSRSELNTNPESAMKWRGLVLDYRGWMRAPEVV